MAGLLLDFGHAWRLLTIIPLPFIPEDYSRPPGYAAGYYPLVGLLLGLLLASGHGVLIAWLPAGVTAALLLTVWAGLTGLLHLDGFMDSCDGLLPPRSRERRLEIMKDSRVGAFGVVGAILLLLVKYNTLAALPAAQALPALVVVPVLARWAMTWQMFRYPVARPAGLGVFFRQGLGWPQVVLASLIAVGAAWYGHGWWGIGLWLATWLVAALLARLALARLAGLTGDVYGATCEAVEALLLVGLAL